MPDFEVYADLKRNTLNVDYPCEGWIVDNTQCAADVTLSDVRGIGFTVKAGNLYALNFTPATTMFAQSTLVVAGTGACHITASEGAVNTDNNNPQALVTSGTITTPPGGLPTSDPTAQAYLAALQGLLPQGLRTFVYAGNVGGGPNAEQTFVLVNAVTQFSLAFIPNAKASGAASYYDGVLWVFYIVVGTRVYLDNKPFYSWVWASFQSQQLPIWLPYHEYIPAGATLGVGYDGEGTVLVRV